MNFTATIRDPPLPSRSSSASSKKSAAERGRTGFVPCPGRRSGFLRRTVQQIVNAVLSLPILGDLAPQMVEQLLDIMRFFDTLTPDPEQVIEVPKTLPGGSVDGRILFFVAADCGAERGHSSSCSGGRLAGPQGFLPGQSSTAPTVAQIVDSPGGGLQGLRPGEDLPASSSFLSPSCFG